MEPCPEFVISNLWFRKFSEMECILFFFFWWGGWRGCPDQTWKELLTNTAGTGRKISKGFQRVINVSNSLHCPLFFSQVKQISLLLGESGLITWIIALPSYLSRICILSLKCQLGKRKRYCQPWQWGACMESRWVEIPRERGEGLSWCRRS